MMLRELKARKAKHGFDGGTIGLQNVIVLGKFMEALESNHTGKYLAEEVGMHHDQLRLYTDVDDVAQWIRDYKF